MTWPTKRQKAKIKTSSKVPTSAEGSLTMTYYSAEHKKFDQYDQHDLTKQKTKAKTKINTSSTVLTLAEESLTMTCYYSAEPKTCQLWHTWSEWRGHTSWPTKRIKMTKKKATTKVKTKILKFYGPLLASAEDWGETQNYMLLSRSLSISIIALWQIGD